MSAHSVTSTQPLVAAPTGGASPSQPPSIAGYDLVRMIGRGGMGAVWEAREHRFDRGVALKVHTGELTSERVAQMWSEAQLAAKIGHPGVVSVYDYGYTLDGRPYYTMDLVEGTELSALVREAALPQARALAIAAEIAHAVAAAHERGVLHRDLKPRNVLIDAGGHARVLDFGLAMRLEEAAGATNAMVIGSPPYMSPEHVGGRPTTAASDVYSIGVILYEMLTGARPFEAASRDELLYKIVTEPAAPPSVHSPDLSSDVEQVCLRCLEKDPTQRFPSARALAEALTAAMEGRPITEFLPSARPLYAPRAALALSAASPSPRRGREDAPMHVRRSWVLRSSPDKLWPYVANTERFNKAIGLPAVDFVDSPDPRGGSSRMGRFRVLGMSVVWEEHPFEWVNEREHGVYRRYHEGPLRALWSRVQLNPHPGGGTELVHEIWATPIGPLGWLAATFEIRWKAVRNIDRVYRRLDEVLAEGHEPDAFEPAHRPDGMQRSRVEQAGRMLEETRGFPHHLVAELCGLLLYAPTKRLEALRPYELADAWGHDRSETLDLCLHAANAGLLDVAWDLICPDCQLAHEQAASLRQVRRSGSCAACNNAAFERDLARSVELVFRPHREVRRAARTTFCVGSPAMRPHVLAQQVLDPGETREVSVDLACGSYRIAGPRLSAAWQFDASRAGYGSECDIAVGEDGIDARPVVVRAGEVVLRLTNASEHEQIVRIERAGVREDAVTAAVAMSHPSFHDFFSAELLAHGEHIAVSRMAFLFLDIENRAALLDELGDAGAYGVMTAFEDLVDAEVRRCGGTVAIASFDQTAMATFATAALAVRGALAIRAALAERRSPVQLRGAVHEGRCIAVTRGERTEYFGETVQRGNALLAECSGGDIALSSTVADDRSSAAIFHAARVPVEVTTATLRPYRGRRIVRLLGAG